MAELMKEAIYKYFTLEILNQMKNVFYFLWSY